MDELFDIFDAVSALDDLTELTDHADTLLAALDGLDYVQIDADDLEAIDALTTFGAEDLDPSELMDSGAFVDGDWNSFDVLETADAEDFGNVAQFVTDELGDYPDHFKEGLDGVEYHLDPRPGEFGWWEQHGDSAHIELFDRQDALPLTLHHEMAHHVMSGHPELLEAITPHMADSPMIEQMELNLDAYPVAQQPEEFVAETFAYFKTKPTLLQEFDPELYQKFATWWDGQAGLA